MWRRARKLTTYTILGVASLGTAYSLHKNEYQVDSIAIVRLTRAAVAVFRIGSFYRSHLYEHGLDKSSAEYRKLKSFCHKTGAEIMLELCCANRGVYIKVGQHLAALEYMLPKEYTETMKVLHSHAPTNKLEDVYKVIKEDFKKDASELFANIDPTPLGTASLAQVHKATLHDGRVVAVKVQHPYVKGNSLVDLKTMELLVKIVSYTFPEFKFQWVVDETKKNIPQELDFANEGKNAEKAAELYANLPWLKIPKVIWELTTPRVITMEFLDGGQVNDLPYIKQHKIDPFEISDKLGQLYSKMIFIDGFMHSDPHPGNILVKKTKKGDCDIILLDHGLYATLSKEFRADYANLWLSILNKDRTSMRLYTTRLGIKGDMYGLFACMITGRTWDSIISGIESKKTSQSEKDLFQSELPNLLPEISGILDTVNPQMLLVLKANDLMRGIEYTLRTNERMGAFGVMSRCCVRSVYSHWLGETGAHERWRRWRLLAGQYWQLLQLTVYYALLRVRYWRQGGGEGAGEECTELVTR